MKNLNKKLLSGILAVFFAISLTGCQKELAMDENFPSFQLSQKVLEAKEKNSDVIGWIKVPGTDIDNVVMYSSDNDNYQRTTIDGQWDYFGEYFVDMDNVKAKSGLSDKFDLHTIIYGHNVYNGRKNLTQWQGHKIPDYGVDKVPTDYKDGEKFAQLFRYLDEDFAKENPYIYIGTDKEETPWEIFSVYYTDIKSFNRWNGYETMATKEGMMNTVSDSLAKSLYDFNVDVKETDKIITLSTCSYIDGADNHDLRFHVAARKVLPGEEFKEEANITKNENKISMDKTALKYPVKAINREA